MSSPPSIVTVTFHPAIDLTVFVEHLVPGTVHRVCRSQYQAGGKGLNVATMLALGGHAVVVSGFLGAANAAIFEQHFDRYRLRDAFVRVPGETRTGIKVVGTQRRETTDFNLQGAAPSAPQCAALVQRLLALAEPGRWFVLAGSLPTGLEPDFVADLIQRLRALGAKVAIDFSGAALAAALKAGVDLAKPNQYELAEYFGVPPHDFEALLAAARQLQGECVPQLIVSLGADGAWFLSAAGEWRTSAPTVPVVSTVGAGDALLAGYLAGLCLGASRQDCARRATVYAGSRLASLLPQIPSPAELEQGLRQVRVGAIGA